jgi:hypothetical protein
MIVAGYGLFPRITALNVSSQMAENAWHGFFILFLQRNKKFQQPVRF